MLVESNDIVRVRAETIASWAVRLPDEKPDALAKAMRDGEPVVMGRIEEEHLLLDARTVREEEIDLLVRVVEGARG